MKKLIKHISNEIADDLKLYNEYLATSLDSKVNLSSCINFTLNDSYNQMIIIIIQMVRKGFIIIMM